MPAILIPRFPRNCKMNQPVIRSHVLCGGSGTRLWPLSRKTFPKQFIPIVGAKSLLQLTLERLAGLGDITCIAAEEHRFLVEDVARTSGLSVAQILEPCARNTAAAIALAVHISEPSDLLLFCPADHHIPDGVRFNAMVTEAATTAGEQIVTFGVVPTFPSTGYGYLEEGVPLSSGGCSVSQFIEKPDAERAGQLLLSGRHLWNAGIFLARSSVWAEALRMHAPSIWEMTRQAMERRTVDGGFIRPRPDLFQQCPADSIDYAVMEKAANLAVHRFSGAWSDVGSWNAVAAFGRSADDDNRFGGSEGQALFIDAKNTYLHTSHRPVVALGTQNLLVIDTPDALLVADSAQAENVKKAVALLEELGAPQAAVHRKVARPWGHYDSVDQGERHQVKRITVRPGAKLSLQLHHYRAEHWIVVKGVARVTRGDEILVLTENQSTYIPLGVQHRLENVGDADLEIIEVQSGSYLGEDDIVRFEDNYGRVPNS